MLKYIYFLIFILISKPCIAELKSFEYILPEFSPTELISESKNTNYDNLPIVTRGSKMNIFAKASPSVVKIITQDGFGSGVILDQHVVTNYHVIEGYSTVGVQFINDNQSENLTLGSVLKYDVIKDLALIKVNQKRHDIIPIRVSTDIINVGDDVHAIGHPSGQENIYSRLCFSKKR